VAFGISGIVMSSNLQGLAHRRFLWERRPGPRENTDMGPRAQPGQGAEDVPDGTETRKNGNEQMAVSEADDAFARPRPLPRRVEPLSLDLLGVAELEAYIGELEAEIARVRGDILRKQRHRDAAHAFFKPAVTSSAPTDE